jgi:hypothetical protein
MSEKPTASVEHPFDQAHFQQVYAALHEAVLNAGGKSADAVRMVRVNETLSAMAALTAALAVQFGAIDTSRKTKAFAEDHAKMVARYIAMYHRSGEKRPFSHTTVLLHPEKRQ